MKAISTLALLLICSLSQGQSIVREFLDNDIPEGGRSFYLYQSTLRSFSDKNSVAFNKLIKDVEKISIHLLPDSLAPGKLETLEKTLRAEGYDDAKALPEKVPGLKLLVIKKGKSKHYVAMMQESGKSVVVELEGEVNLLYIKSLKELNIERVMGFFGVEPPKKQTPENTNK